MPTPATPAARPVRPRSNERSGGRLRSRGGFSLLEVLISVLLVAVMTASVFSVALTAKTAGGSTDRKVIGGLATRQLSSQLKSLVTTYWDYNNNAWYSGCAGGAPCANNDIAGPMTCSAGGPAGPCSWEWGATPPGCAGAGTCISDSCPAGSPCYALQAGAHVLTNYLPGWMEAAPYNGRVCYYVCGPGSVATSYACGPSNVTADCSAQKTASFTGGVSPSVIIAVNWTEP